MQSRPSFSLSLSAILFSMSYSILAAQAASALGSYDIYLRSKLMGRHAAFPQHSSAMSNLIAKAQQELHQLAQQNNKVQGQKYFDTLGGLALGKRSDPIRTEMSQIGLGQAGTQPAASTLDRLWQLNETPPKIAAGDEQFLPTYDVTKQGIVSPRAGGPLIDDSAPIIVMSDMKPVF